ncbi:MAG: bifunctional hydroxymethylpyrimidine kinase/phosphomethylpyrimidine kinase [Deltaproteobacteria bacterium]|nr:bifunctional hydroxymethylpyrimidine kinase/phosphomethylpyrimidine kinase [Deltaproteobacteria bacterium]
MKKVLTIGGSDPSGWAGVGADILTFAKFGVRGFSAMTAITAQTEKGVKAIEPVSMRVLKKQIETLLNEHSIDGVKIGMLATPETADMVARLIKKWKLKNVVLDPILRSTGGFPLIGKGGIMAIKRLLPLVTVATPNLDEAEILSKMRVKTVEDMKEAAKKIRSLGAAYVLIKGGHLKGSPVDVLYDGKKISCYRGRRLKEKKEKFHGTGCLLSSAIAAGLAKGNSVARAVKDAKGYVKKILRKRR